ncbi:DUF1853 family protein [Aestuariicella hydrocarbonica]|uniref:DUF1853 family protein n=1 Tax=Pseudomaricurvus hydrocarbonicus TaxID=1470433 RepID=A0A9E5JTK4_9GAMM|nr:DUF1853 family protein [Aestuariicella hydrocarbonica]NHO65323.1 DUF1853 family protein [Aestuariicella hydrocarbonica]
MKTDYLQPPRSALKHPLVRNLAWCIFSPPLVDVRHIQSATISSSHTRSDETLPLSAAPDNGMTPQDCAWLESLDESPEPLEQWMKQCPSSRLGFQFEYYWQFWWQRRSPHLEHRFNIQLHQNGKTLGEVDAVSWNPNTGELVHSELAVKFYLGIESDKLPREKRADSRYSWVGPQAIDRLDLKWHQLVDKQLQRLHPAAKSTDRICSAAITLPAHWQVEKLTTQLIMRGRLFYPARGMPGKELPAYLHPLHLRGRWLKLQELTSMPPTYWVLLARHQWLSPQAVPLSNKSDAISTGALHDLLTTHFASHQQPVQVIRLAPSANHWREQERLFVVPNQWPSIT